jgi:hypothetical protein
MDFKESMNMKSQRASRGLTSPVRIVGAPACACVLALLVLAAQQSWGTQTLAATAQATAGARTFDTPRQAADALVDAAEKFDLGMLVEIFGQEGEDIVLSGEYPRDRKAASDFAAEAHEKQRVFMDPKDANRAFLVVGKENWPFPAPIVKRGDRWSFDANAGRQELFHRRIGSNELDAIEICHGYVEAQHEYAERKQEGYDVNQYAQRVISTPGKHDGIAWQNIDGTWGGPIGEKIARAIQQGYAAGAKPYHGYFFKALKGQGPAAPLGEMDFLVKGVMIGGFALAATPAEYGETGMNTFIVSHDGIVYQKDFGPASLEAFTNMELYNPDRSWKRVAKE